MEDIPKILQSLGYGVYNKWCKFSSFSAGPHKTQTVLEKNGRHLCMLLGLTAEASFKHATAELQAGWHDDFRVLSRY